MNAAPALSQSDFETVGALSQETVNSMWRLYSRYYGGCTEQRFRDDLTAKSEALLIRQGDRLIGFSLYQLYAHTHDGRSIRVLYSGDTIVDQAHWGQQQLAFSWIRRAGEIQRQAPETPLYWFLIVKGHRTYRYLPVFSRRFHPHWERSEPELARIAAALAGDKFGTAYQADTGILRFAESLGHLKHEFGLPTERERSNPAVSFFLRANPGYLRGDELVCLCELCEANLRPLAQRIFHGP